MRILGASCLIACRLGWKESRVGWTLSPAPCAGLASGLTRRRELALWLRFEEVRERSAKERGDDVAPAESLLAWRELRR